jgi:histidinol-phosphatase (PHP family)
MHGGHSHEFNQHGSSTLVQILDRAVERGFTTYGITGHAPPSEARFLYPDEVEAGLDLARRADQFHQYAAAATRAADQYADRLTVLRGFEAEVVPSSSFVEDMRHLRDRFQFEYVVGSVHWVDDVPIDLTPERFLEVVERCGGLQHLLVRYYRLVAGMVDALRPEVLGHLDLPRLFSANEAAHRAPAVRAAVDEVLTLVAEAGILLEINTAGYRKGLGTPYPAQWTIGRARELGCHLTLSDDSHHVDHVGASYDEARELLLGLGIRTIFTLDRASDGSTQQREVPL